MRRGSTFLAVIAVCLFFFGVLRARPVTPYEAELVVTGWLRTDPRPLDTAVGRNVTDVETVTGDYGELIYYVVHMEPSGFVIVSADDGIEPIIAFADDGTFEPSPANPLGAMTANDLTRRLDAAENSIGLLSEVPNGNQAKWRDLIDIGQAPPSFELMGFGSVSDILVAPMIKSTWGQMQVCGKPCYNYYTPNNYPAGCVATAMAQLMRYHEFPTARTGIGRHQFSIVVDGQQQSATTRGGDGNGGPYRWSSMLDTPRCNATEAQRQAIGALCYDAGIAAEMDYTKEGSGTNMGMAHDAMLNTFRYSNAVVAWDGNENIDIGLYDMINTNLDAAYPVLLGIIRDEYGHAVICDGYGYNGATLYHHINMGWDGFHDAWYNLPNIDSNPSYTSVFDILYNVFPSGAGEIISGRVLDPLGEPVAGVTVEAQGDGGPFTAITDSRGVYAFANVKSSTSYTIEATAEGYYFTAQTVRTGTSRNESVTCGNKWGVDFNGEDACRYMAEEDFETGDFSKLTWGHSGACDWLVTSTIRHSGSYSARSGPAQNRQSTTLSITQDCNDGEITFFVKVSCESDWDFLAFSIDGQEMDTWSGDKDWQKASFPVTAGTRVFEWTYLKDGSGSEGDDCAWIDDVTFPITACPEPTPPPPGPEPPPPPEPTQGGLVGWWKLDESAGNIALDSSGNANHGTLSGNPRWVAGKIGRALQFDGSGDRVDCGNDSTLNLTNAVTITAWIKPNVIWLDQKIAGNQDGWAGGYKMGLYPNNKVEFEIRTSSNQAVLNRDVGGGTTLRENLWYHVAGVYSSSSRYIRTYVNGNLDRQLNTSEQLGRTSGAFKLGCEPFTNLFFWNGTIDDVRVYNKALTADEIKAVMSGTR